MIERQERISAAIDGELDGMDEANWKALAQRWTDEDEQTLNLYSAVGDALRASSLAAFHNPQALASIRAAIAEEPTVLAPRLHPNQPAWHAHFAKQFRYIERIALCGLAVFALAVGLNRAVPVQMSDVQMVKAQARVQVSADDLAAWNDLLLAHQWHSPRGHVLVGGVGHLPQGVAGVGEQTLSINVSNQEPAEWINVWENNTQNEDLVHLNYVSAIH